MRYATLATVAVTALVVAPGTYWLMRPSTIKADTAVDLEVAQRDALDLGNRLVSSRHLPERVAPPQGTPLWKPLLPWAVDTLFAGHTGQSDTLVIYVHGYNTPLSNSIGNGNTLLRELGSSRGVDVETIRFFTFCWRGDFEAIEFERAEGTARQAGQALADFIRQVSTDDAHPQPRNVVVLAHSLGARVALVAARHLWTLAPRQWLSHLVLVQPAVPVADLYVGKYMVIIRESGMTGISEHTHRGEFFESLSVARHVIVTTSAADAVLSNAYYVRRDLPVVGFGIFPRLHAPIGSRGVGGSVMPKHYREIVLTPESLSAESRGHSGLYAGPELIRLLWGIISGQ